MEKGSGLMKSVVIKIRLMVFSGRHQFNHQSAQLNHRKLFKAVEHRLQHTNLDHFGPVCNTLYCEVNESPYFVVLSFFKCPKKKSQTSRAGSPVAHHNVNDLLQYGKIVSNQLAIGSPNWC